MKTLNKALLIMAGVGVLGVTSSGFATDNQVITVSANIPAVTQATNLTTPNFGSLSPDTYVTNDRNASMCIGSNKADLSYNVKIEALKDDGTTDAGAHVLFSGTDELPYTLEWDDDKDGAAVASSVTYGAGGTTLTGRTAQTTFCGPSDPTTAYLTIRILDSDVQGSKVGTYSGKIKVTSISPG